MQAKVSLLSTSPVWREPVEIVERKGLGHPDTICDALAEELSRRLCQAYLDRFGIVLHHNVDKGLLFGGRSMPAYGGGEVLEPMEIFLVGRATMSYKGVTVPVEELAVEGTRKWFRENFHVLDPERHVKIRCLIRPGSTDLVDLYLRQARTGIAMANDTSCGVGFAPFDQLETLVHGLERYLNSPEIRKEHPAFGQDIKVMGVRTHDSIELTVACAFVDRYIKDLSNYLEHKKELGRLAKEKARSITDLPVNVAVNAADDPDSESLYLTVTGTSGEAGDDGEVGRGNRVNGLITPFRPMNMEAAAGKNPITHVGKIYNIVSKDIAERIVLELQQVEEAYCYIVSRIGSPINRPLSFEVKLRVPDEAVLQSLEPKIQEICRDEMDKLADLWRRVVSGEIQVF